MKERVIDKAGHLPQHDILWVATVRKARAWVGPKGRTPFRPYIILVMDAQADAYVNQNSSKSARISKPYYQFSWTPCETRWRDQAGVCGQLALS